MEKRREGEGEIYMGVLREWERELEVSLEVRTVGAGRGFAAFTHFAVTVSELPIASSPPQSFMTCFSVH